MKMLINDVLRTSFLLEAKTFGSFIIFACYWPVKDDDYLILAKIDDDNKYCYIIGISHAILQHDTRIQKFPTTLLISRKLVKLINKIITQNK